MRRMTISFSAFVLFGIPVSAWALEPADVILLVNKNLPESASVAEHYRAKQAYPPRM